MIIKLNKPAPPAPAPLVNGEVTIVLQEWAHGQTVEQVQHEHFYEPVFIQPLFDQCEEVQAKCNEVMREEPPGNLTALKARMNVLGIAISDAIVDLIIKHSDINNNGDWDMYKSYDWGTE